MMDDALLTPAQLVKITGKRTADQQAKALVKMRVPFKYLGRAVEVSRAAAEAHQLLPEPPRKGGVDFGSVR